MSGVCMHLPACACVIMLLCMRVLLLIVACVMPSTATCSAMEGKFYRYKSKNHPHTNMAKVKPFLPVRSHVLEVYCTHL